MATKKQKPLGSLEARQGDFDKLVKGVANGLTPGAVLVFQVENGVMKSQLVSHGLPLGSVGHLIMESYVAGAGALAARIAEEKAAEATQK